MAQINFRIDDEMKKKAETLFNSLGMTMSSAITVFIAQSISVQGIPFVIRRGGASAYHEKLLHIRNDYENGKRNYHFHDLIEVDDEQGAKAKPRRASNRRKRAHA